MMNNRNKTMKNDEAEKKKIKKDEKEGNNTMKNDEKERKKQEKMMIKSGKKLET